MCINTEFKKSINQSLQCPFKGAELGGLGYFLYQVIDPGGVYTSSTYEVARFGSIQWLLIQGDLGCSEFLLHATKFDLIMINHLALVLHNRINNDVIRISATPKIVLSYVISVASSHLEYFQA